ncbi:hypothetical protein ACFOON_10610 [Novosphingobium piscinae]|uniref:hypothetical protein n=1 Tax=Novosphingobium piscinae TaxID=1507448 RepID=UPI00361683AB
MIAPIVLVATLVAPDPAPLRTALERCDRGAIAALTAIEPKRRAAFSGAAYDEQRAIATERAQLDAGLLGEGGAVASQPGPAPAAGDRVRAALEARQRRLDDARTVERAWRESLEDGRAAFLAQCTGRRDGNQP